MSFESRHQKRLELLCHSMSSSMSNAKWVRLINVLSHFSLVSHWMFLDDDREFRMPNFTPGCIVDGKGIGDICASGPFVFEDVLQIRWPYEFDSRNDSLREPLVVQQAISELESAILGEGHFDIERDANNLFLYAYR